MGLQIPLKVYLTPILSDCDANDFAFYYIDSEKQHDGALIQDSLRYGIGTLQQVISSLFKDVTIKQKI